MALNPKAHTAPSWATITPPMAGPMERAMLMPMELSATAEGSIGCGTSSETIAACAGIAIAAPQPMQKVSNTSSCGVSRSNAVSTAVAAATSSIQPWVNSRYLRRSTMSARVPAASANSTIGTVVADCTSATISAEPVRSAITQAAATSLTQVPMLLARIASQIERNMRIFNGDHAPSTCGECCDADAFTIAKLQRLRRTACPGRRPASVQDPRRPRPAAAAIASGH